MFKEYHNTNRNQALNSSFYSSKNLLCLSCNENPRSAAVFCYTCCSAEQLLSSFVGYLSGRYEKKRRVVNVIFRRCIRSRWSYATFKQEHIAREARVSLRLVSEVVSQLKALGVMHVTERYVFHHRWRRVLQTSNGYHLADTFRSRSILLRLWDYLSCVRTIPWLSLSVFLLFSVSQAYSLVHFRGAYERSAYHNLKRCFNKEKGIDNDLQYLLRYGSTTRARVNRSGVWSGEEQAVYQWGEKMPMFSIGKMKQYPRNPVSGCKYCNQCNQFHLCERGVGCISCGTLEFVDGSIQYANWYRFGDEANISPNKGKDQGQETRRMSEDGHMKCDAACTLCQRFQLCGQKKGCYRCGSLQINSDGKLEKVYDVEAYKTRNSGIE